MDALALFLIAAKKKIGAACFAPTVRGASVLNCGEGERDDLRPSAAATAIRTREDSFPRRLLSQSAR